MKNSPYMIDAEESSESFNFKEILIKYLSYWKWFIFFLLLFVISAFIYLRYTSVIYSTNAKIKIIDDSKELDIASDPLKLLSGKPNINLDNEIEIIKSYRLLNEVVQELKLDISYFEYGKIKKTEIWDSPFIVTKTIADDSVKKPITYKLSIKQNSITVIDKDDIVYDIPLDSVDNYKVLNLPFEIKLKNNLTSNYEDITFEIIITSFKDAVLNLTKKFKVEATNKDSEILLLSLEGESSQKSEIILNEIIRKFDLDGIKDRQLVSKRTLDFIDERFIYLSTELDSIEVGKQDFKQSNDLSYIEADAEMTIQNKSITESELANLNTQISISKLLKGTIENQVDYSILPAEIGVDNGSLNVLVSEYNKLALERNKLTVSIGENHPTLQAINSQLAQGKVNILKTLNVYQEQLLTSLNQLTQDRNKAGSQFARLPEKDRMLRSIERQQSIKENLFLLLLQKREEAAINLAVTAPSIKVVDYGLTNDIPVSPKKIIVYAFALLLGFLIPFSVLYVKFMLDTKIHDRSDIEKINPGIAIVSEIPFFKEKKSFIDATDRSILAESFRILSTNSNYLLPKKTAGTGQVIYVTSTIKGEGKSLTSFNLSLAYASINKKVLLVGADLRNPQLHTFFNVNKNTKGLVDYLYDTELQVKDCINDGFATNANHKVCFSGPIPPNAPELLSGKRFEEFIVEVSALFDYIIIDTAPTLLVTDTLLISKYADLTLFVTRAGFTEKHLLDFSKDLFKTNKMNNMAYVLNEVGLGKASDYNYGYGYGYSSSDK